MSYGCEGCPGKKFSSVTEMLQHGHDVHGYPAPQVECGCSQKEGFLCPTHAVLNDKSEKIRALELQVGQYQDRVASLGCDKPERFTNSAGFHDFDDCGECLPCKAKAAVTERPKLDPPLCEKCSKVPAEWVCDGKSPEIAEHLKHDQHYFCGPCDVGCGCAMVGKRIPSKAKSEGGE